MAWIEAHQSLSRHRKVLTTAGRLSVDRHLLIGHLLELWWWALDNVGIDGCLGGLSHTEIAMAAQWDGDAQEFTTALIVGGLIDETAAGLALHDWYDYAGKLIERRVRERKRSQERRGHAPADRATTAGRPAADRATTAGTVPYRTVPNQGSNTYTPPYPEIAEAWNRICGDVLSRVQSLTDKRKVHIRARIGKDEERRQLPWWEAYFRAIRAKPFLCGDNDKGWRADFEFAVKSEDNVAKILEGKYNQKGGARNERGQPQTHGRQQYGSIDARDFGRLAGPDAGADKGDGSSPPE